MIIRNVELEGFIQFLNTLELVGKQSRFRSRLIRLLQEKLTVIKAEHRDIVEKYSKKDSEGKPQYRSVDEQTGYVEYDIEDMSGLAAELNELYGENTVVDQSESNRELLLIVKEAVLDCTLTFSGEQAELYNRYCEIVEGIAYDTK